MTFRMNADKNAAVALHYYYLPIESCPKGVSIIGLSKGGVARVDKVGSDPGDLVAWAPLPRRPQWLNELEGRS